MAVKLYNKVENENGDTKYHLQISYGLQVYLIIF